jgi:hypothetical protein
MVMSEVEERVEKKKKIVEELKKLREKRGE